MNEFQVGDDVNETALAEFADRLKQAYANGEASGGTMDWDDVQEALDKAVEAFGPQAEAFMTVATSEDGFTEEPTITFPSDSSWETRSAATLLIAYRYPSEVKWEDVDASWEILLQADVERGTKPSR